jgi:hypothetical protein
MDDKSKTDGRGIAELLINAPKYDLIGPTVDDDIRRAISRYGADAIKNSVKRLTKAKPGRKPERDWPEITDILVEDARKLLSGGNPFSERTNYAIARDHARKGPAHYVASTHRRMMKKLAEKRVKFTYLHAEIIAEEEFGVVDYAIFLKRMMEVVPEWERYCREKLGDVVRAISEYASKFDENPKDLTLAEVEAKAKQPILGAALSDPTLPALGSLFGLSGGTRGG